jgi:hypothetical protein
VIENGFITVKLSDLFPMNDSDFWRCWDALGEIIKARNTIGKYAPTKPILGYSNNYYEYESDAQARMG